MINYYEIGQRVRKYRKAYGLSQEELAEKVNISTTHLSHIETGNTKLSLPALVELASVLEVRVDDLLFGQRAISKNDDVADIAQILDTCSAAEVAMMRDLVAAAKTSIDKHLK